MARLHSQGAKRWFAIAHGLFLRVSFPAAGASRGSPEGWGHTIGLCLDSHGEAARTTLEC